MEPIDLVVGGERWRIRRWTGGVGVSLLRSLPRDHDSGMARETVAEAASLAGLLMEIKDAGFRAVYPEAVEPLCRAIQERMEDKQQC